ncbi:ABC transporter permease [Leifsonia sp. McL0607]|uniref:ABC transporter permease n=1 Tax=Leifsonia sp. McL0607 TaxID=3415672 RepID=UPI003CFAA82D
MKITDVATSAIGNTFRSKTRTTLTIVAIFIGGFTLTITNGLGTGINRYIDDTVASMGATDVMTVTRPVTQDTTSGPQKYEPGQVTSDQGPRGLQTLDPIGQAQLDQLAGIDGVLSVQPVKSVQVDYVRASSDASSSTAYQISVGSFVAGMKVQLADGSQPSETATEPQVAIPVDYVKALGFASNSAALGQQVVFGLSDAIGGAHTVGATIVGISEAGLGGGSASATPNQAMTNALFQAQSTGLSAAKAATYSSATIRFDDKATTDQVQALKDRLSAAGYTGTTLQDTLGSFKSVIDAIVLVLNAFAIIALLAASFGIVNTLFMSVQERTREIGLMKAMGMGGGKIFGLFSFEATFIGLLGSAIGVGLGMLAGTAIGSALGTSMFSSLPGLTLIAFDPLSILGIVLLVMGIAFLAGTLPAARAARQDPIESLRYE